MKTIEKTGPTVDEAVAAALADLGVTRDEVEVEVVSETQKARFLGLSAQTEVVVAVTVKVGVDPAAPEAGSAPAAGQEARAQQLLEEILGRLGVSASVEVGGRDHDGLHLDIVGDDLAFIIGKRGQTLHALQYLVNTILNQSSERGGPKGPGDVRVVLDAASYRERRQQALERMAHKAVEKAIERGRRVRLDPMPSYERRIIHMALADHPEVRTVSDGEEPYRQVIVELKQRPAVRDVQPGGRGQRRGGSGSGASGSGASGEKGSSTAFAPRPPAPRTRPQPEKNLQAWDTRIFDDMFSDDKTSDQ